MNKTGYFFIIDSIVALSVLSIGVFLLYSFNEAKTSTEQPYTISADVLNVLSYNKIKFVDNEYAGPNSILTRNGNITDIDKTLLEQVAEFYYRYKDKGCSFCLNLTESFISNITANMVPSSYNYIINLDNQTIYLRNNSPINNSKFTVPARKIVHGIYNGSELYGPYVAEVISWG
jgi:hypothetical protein